MNCINIASVLLSRLHYFYLTSWKLKVYSREILKWNFFHKKRNITHHLFQKQTVLKTKWFISRVNSAMTHHLNYKIEHSGLTRFFLYFYGCLGWAVRDILLSFAKPCFEKGGSMFLARSVYFVQYCSIFFKNIQRVTNSGKCFKLGHYIQHNIVRSFLKT